MKIILLLIGGLGMFENDLLCKEQQQCKARPPVGFEKVTFSDGSDENPEHWSAKKAHSASYIFSTLVMEPGFTCNTELGQLDKVHKV